MASINLSGVEPYNGKPTTVKIDVEAGEEQNQLNLATASLEQSSGSWGIPNEAYAGTKVVSLVDHVTKSSEENILTPESASLDAGIGDWVTDYGLISYTSEGPAKNLLSYGSAVLEGLGSSIGGWEVLGSFDPRVGSKTAFIPGGLASMNSVQKNQLNSDTASMENSIGNWIGDANCSSVTRQVSSLFVPPLIGEHVGQFSSIAAGACRIRASTISATTSTGYAAIVYVRKFGGTFTQARVGIKWSTGVTTWSAYSTVSTGGWTKLSLNTISPASSVTTAQVVVEYTATAAGNSLLFDKAHLGGRALDSVGEWYYPTSLTGDFAAVGENHGVLVNSALNTAGVGTNRVFSERVGGTLAVGTTRYASAYLSTKSATYITSARVGINWDNTSTIDWGSPITPSDSSWTQATATGTAAAGNIGFRVVIEFTIASSAGAQAEGYFDKVSAGVGSTAYWSVPGITATINGVPDTVFDPVVGDGYGLITSNEHSNSETLPVIYETGTKDCEEGDVVSVSALLSARDNKAIGGRVGIEWLGSASYSWASGYQLLTVGTWKESSLSGVSAPAGATGWRVVIEFKFSADSTGGLFDRISTSRTGTPDWSYPALEDSPSSAAVGSGYGVVTTTDSTSGTIRISSGLVNPTVPGATHSVVASLSKGENTVISGRVGILWRASGGILDWGDSVSIDDTGTWYEATIEGATAPAGTNGWYVVIEYETTGITNSAYFDKIAAVAGSTAAYNDGTPKTLSITRSTVGYPGEKVVYDGAFIGSYTYYDRAVPLDCQVTYNLLYGSGPTSQAESASITLDGVPSDSQVCYPCLVSDPKNTDYIQAATLQIYRPFEYQERMSINDVIGSAYPIALSGKRSAARGSITMITHTQRQADMMRTMFSTGRSLMFRVMSEARPEKPAIAIAVSKVAEEPVILPHISRPERKWNIDFVEIALPVVEQLFITENTWGTLGDETTQPSGIAGSYASWNALVDNENEQTPNWYYVVSNPDAVTIN